MTTLYDTGPKAYKPGDIPKLRDLKNDMRALKGIPAPVEVVEAIHIVYLWVDSLLTGLEIAELIAQHIEE